MEFIACPACGKSVDPTEQRCFDQFLETLPWFAKEYDLVRSIQALHRHPEFQNVNWACNDCLECGRAIMGEAKKQKYCDYWPHYAYWDKSNVCQVCGSEFIFEAKEQKHWYETLSFWVQSHPKNCKSCYLKRKNR